MADNTLQLDVQAPLTSAPADPTLLGTAFLEFWKSLVARPDTVGTETPDKYLRVAPLAGSFGSTSSAQLNQTVRLQTDFWGRDAVDAFALKLAQNTSVLAKAAKLACGTVIRVTGHRAGVTNPLASSSSTTLPVRMALGCASSDPTVNYDAPLLCCRWELLHLYCDLCCPWFRSFE